MKRLFPTSALLIATAVTPASAEFLMIKIDLNKLPPQYESPQMRPGGQPRPQAGPRPSGPPGTATDESKERPLWATAYIQLKQKPTEVAIGQLTLSNIEHQWGRTLLPKSIDKIGTLKFYHVPSVSTRFIERRKAVEKEGKAPEKLLQLAEWALEHGLLKSSAATGTANAFLEIMDELGKVDAKNEAVLAFKQVREAIARPVSGMDPLAGPMIDELKKNYREVSNDKGHYVLFTDLSPEKQNEIDLQKWLERLEDNYRGFYYWFAVRGKVLPVPRHRLVAVVATRNDFEQKQNNYNPAPPVADGFLARRENVAVFSAVPLDAAYIKLDQYNRKDWETANVGRKELLSGLVRGRRDLDRNPMQNALDIAKFETLAVLQRAMEKEGARAAVTHAGTRQLLAASGLLPRGVITAEWAHFGMTSFFETPFRAFYVGVGLPSWMYLVEFRHLKTTGELGPSRDVLFKTITDRYFVAANTTLQQLDATKDEREILERVLQDELMTARTTAWALTYYLAKHKLDKLERYFQELASLPRDLDFDEVVLERCFAKAFSMEDAMKPGKLDDTKFKKLADAWYTSMEGESLDLREVQVDALKERAKQKRGPAPATAQ